jgi:hypothetical protein
LLLFFWLQRLAQDAAKAVKLREEVTRAQADAVTMGARAAWMEEMVWEKAALLEAAHGKEVEADQRASTLWGELVAMR